jgi:acetyl esterase/lipase
MPQLPEFTAGDIDEARRLNAKLNWLPRFRMQTALGRVILNGLLWVVQIYPLLRGRPTNARRELRTAEALDRKVKVRIFRPVGECQGVVIDIHGGGWTIGNARLADDQNAELASRIGVAVVSIDYQLALAAPIDAVIDDCEAAVVWTLFHAEQEFGTKRVVVKAFSAGAHLAALALLRLRDRHGMADRIDGAVLYFGLYDFSGTAMVRAAGPENLILHGPTVRSTLKKLTPDLTEDERRGPSVSPLYADLSSLPPALFIVGAADLMLEDSEKMEARWRAANGNSMLIIAPDTPHAFNRLGTAIAAKVEAFVDEWITERWT